MIIHGNNIDVLKSYPDNYFSACVTDPPYGLGKEPNPVDVMKDWIEKGYHEVSNKGGFMNKTWDAFVPQPILWKEVYRVLKPGGHMLVACAPRTQDWMMMSLRFAGFEIRDIVTHHFASGFPKSQNISLAIDKQAGAEREVIGSNPNSRKTNGNISICKKDGTNTITAPATEAAKQWAGFGSAIKPSTEMYTLCRKPISEKTIAENVMKWGCGGLNIDGCRIDVLDTIGDRPASSKRASGAFLNTDPYTPNPQGRWPANLVFSCDCDGPHLPGCPVGELDRQSGVRKSGSGAIRKNAKGLFSLGGDGIANIEYADTGTASRFFFVAKPSRAERNKGLEGMEKKTTTDGRNTSIDNAFLRGETVRTNAHPTVKPVKLMRYLCRLITPPGGIILDPFNGSGTTGIAAALEWFEYVGIEQEEEHVTVSKARQPPPDLFTSNNNK